MQNGKEGEVYKARLEVAMKAFNGGYVIFSPATQKLYTPREFLESDEKVEFKTYGMNDYTNFTLLSPKEAIKRRLEDLRKAQNELDSCMTKVLNAFQFKPVESKTKKP